MCPVRGISKGCITSAPLYEPMFTVFLLLRFLGLFTLLCFIGSLHILCGFHETHIGVTRTYNESA